MKEFYPNEHTRITHKINYSVGKLLIPDFKKARYSTIMHDGAVEAARDRDRDHQEDDVGFRYTQVSNALDVIDMMLTSSSFGYTLAFRALIADRYAEF